MLSLSGHFWSTNSIKVRLVFLSKPLTHQGMTGGARSLHLREWAPRHWLSRGQSDLLSRDVTGDFGSKVSRVIRPDHPGPSGLQCSPTTPSLPHTCKPYSTSGRVSESVLVTQYHRLGGLKGTEICSSQFWRLESKTEALANLVSAEGPLPGSQMAVFSLYLPMAEGGGSSLGSGRRALICPPD